MKQRISIPWQLWFVRLVATAVVTIAAFPCSPSRAEADVTARVVKYSKQDIVPVHAKLRFSTLIAAKAGLRRMDVTEVVGAV